MKYIFTVSLVLTLLGSSLVSYAGNVAYIYGDISEDGFTPASSAPAGSSTDPYDQMLLTDTGDTGLSIFKAIVEEQGHSIEQYYDQETILDDAFLNNKDVIVFGLHQKIWSSAEKNALDLWLRNGGGMLIYSDSASGGFYRSVGAQNSVGQTASNNLIGAYGIEVMVDQANGAPRINALDTSSIADLHGLRLDAEGVSPIAFAPGDDDVEVLIPYTGRIRTTQGLTITNPEFAALVLRPVGQGHVMALFDRQPLWNNGNGANIQDGDNRTIFAVLIDFLAERPDGVSNLSPSLVIDSPNDAANFVQNDTVNIVATATDADGSIAQVEFSINGQPLGSVDTVEPYTASFVASDIGLYTITATATDDEGAATDADSVSIVVTEDVVVPPVELRQATILSNPVVNGVEYRYFRSVRVSSTSDLVGEPYASGILLSGPSTTPALNDLTSINYGFIFNGYIDAPESGIYTFYTTSDDGSDLFIGDEKVVDNDGSHGAQERSGEIGLEAGLHPITIRYFQGRSSAAFEYAWQEPGFSKQAIPSNVWFLESTQTIANVAPVVALTQPLDNSEFITGDSITITVDASDSDGDISQVELSLNGNVLGIDTTSPYSASFIAAEPGSYTLSALAQDDDGAISSDQVTIVVKPVIIEPIANVEPSITLSQPIDNSQFTTGDSITIAAGASDSDGTISQVEFFLNGVTLSTDLTEPYSASFTAVESGAYMVSAVAQDNDGANSSDQVLIVVNEAVVTPPTGLRQPDAPSNGFVSGIEYDYFRITRPSSTSELVGEPFESGLLLSGPSIAPALNDSISIDYGFVYKGYILVPESGTYTFYTTSDDGSDLFIGDEKVVDNDGSHAAQERSGEIGLEAGLHLITIRYFQGRSSSAFEYAWQGPTFVKQAIPSNVWFSENIQVVVDPIDDLRQATVPSNSLVSGIEYDYFKINRPSSTSDLVGEPFESGILLSGPSIAPALSDSNSFDYGFIYRGYIEVPQNGVYTFYTTSDDGSDLFIGGERVVNNDGSHGAIERSGQIGLEMGVHPITIRYFQGRGGSAFEYAWQGPGFAKQSIPENVWFVEGSQVVVDPIVDPITTTLRQAVIPTETLVSGVQYDYFKNLRVSSTSQLIGNPFASGLLLLGPSLEPAVNDSNNTRDFGFIYKGYIEILESGVYTFYTTSDDGSDLFIGDQEIVDNDGNHGEQERSGQIGLEAGLHPITIRYFQGLSSLKFEYAWQGPNITKQAIPSYVWFVESD